MSQFTLNYFSTEYDPTCCDYRKLVVVDDRASLIDVLPGCSSSFSECLRNHIFGEIDGVLLIYSVTCRNSFERMRVEHRVLSAIAKNRSVDTTNRGDSTQGARHHEIAFCLVGNKMDLVDERQVRRSEGVKLAHELGCSFFETSAKLGHGITESHHELIRAMYKISSGEKIGPTEKERRSSPQNRRVRKLLGLSSVLKRLKNKLI
ncbi:Ras GTPase ras2 [Myotisia sp. PD_48]|nr:Ras GTPase ras2 [Myotisia sp. PD_48]